MKTATYVVRRASACVVRRASILVVAALALIPLSVGNAQVRFERTGYRLTSIGERLAVSARVVDARRRPVANMNIRWRIADPSIASVSPQGVVVSRRVGYTKLWAVSGQDSASALILVDQWAAKFDFSPSIVRFDAVGAKTPLKVQVRDAAGHLIDEQNRKTATCRSLNTRVASLGPNGEVRSHTNGVTYVRCTDRGVADSVRVEVRQRALRAAIADKLGFGTKTVGDTFTIRIAAFDRAGDEIKGAQATWASLNPTVVSVDPLTGFVRSVGQGPAKIVGQVGDATDTLNLQVALAPGMPVPQAVVGDSVAIASPADARGPALQMQSLYLAEGDEAAVNISARDASGTAVTNPDVTLRSTDTSVVAVLPRKRVAARKVGVAYIVGEFGTIRDSMQVSVRAKASATAANAAATTAIAFVRPKFDTVAARVLYARRRDSATTAMKRSSQVAEYSGRIISLTVGAEQAARSTRLSKIYNESRTGLLPGGTVEVAPHRTVKAAVDFRTGTLTTNLPTGEDLKVTEAAADLTFSPAPWLGLRGGYVIRTDKSDLATQQWTFPRASLVARLPFVGGAVTAVMGLSLLPGAKYSADTAKASPQPSALSTAGEAGLEVHSGVLSARLLYYVEKFTFSDFNGERRKDQFSTIRIRLGLQRGR